jgi:hypothetical protein
MRQRVKKVGVCGAAVAGCLAASVVLGPVPVARGQDAAALAGYWEGKGTISDRPIDDAIRKLTRRSETQFWFSCDTQLRCRGEATTLYGATLQAVKWSIPTPAGSIDAAVEGSAEKSTFTYPIEGAISGGKLQLRVVGESADLVVPNGAFEFVLTASATVPSVGGAPSAAPSMQVIRIPAKAWSPFQKLEAPISRRPQGPFVAAVKQSGAKHSIEWHVQRHPSYDLEALKAQLKAEIKAELRRELDTRNR